MQRKNNLKSTGNQAKQIWWTTLLNIMHQRNTQTSGQISSLMSKI